FAHVLLRQQRQPLEVAERLDLFGPNLQPVEQLTIVRHVMVGMANHPAKPELLQLSHLSRRYPLRPHQSVMHPPHPPRDQRPLECHGEKTRLETELPPSSVLRGLPSGFGDAEELVHAVHRFLSETELDEGFDGVLAHISYQLDRPPLDKGLAGISVLEERLHLPEGEPLRVSGNRDEHVEMPVPK